MKNARFLILLTLLTSLLVSPSCSSSEGQQRRVKSVAETFLWDLEFSARELAGIELEAERLAPSSDRKQLLDRIALMHEDMDEAREVYELLEEEPPTGEKLEKLLNGETRRLELIRNDVAEMRNELIAAQRS